MMLKQLTITNEVPSLREIVAFVDDVFRQCQMSHKDSLMVRAGLDEALTNCVRYAYEKPGNSIELTASLEDGRLCFTIKDGGIPFNPLEYVQEQSEELRVGGLGIKMYRSVFEEVRYSRIDGYNILKLIKTL